MKQIARVTIENFQSHTRSDLEFSQGLNVIIGASDHGKSAVLRALRWALYNEPRGSEFVRIGARECRVTVTMSDGAMIMRELTLSKSGAPARNRYVLTLSGGDPQVFEGFGSELPAEVFRAHGMPQVLLDTDKRVGLSFGSQLEGPFLMSETGSLRARAIGRLLGVHVVDAATRETQRDLRTVKQEVARLEREVQRYEALLTPFDDIPAQEAALELAEARLAAADTKSRRLQRLQVAAAEAERTEREAIMAQERLSRLGDLEQAGVQVRQAEQLQRQSTHLQRLEAELGRMEHESGQARTRIAALEALPLAEERTRDARAGQERLVQLFRLQGDLQARELELLQAERAVVALARVERADTAMQEVGVRLQRLERLQQKLTPLQDVEQRLATGRDLLREQEQAFSAALRDYEQVLGRLGQCPTCRQAVAPAAIKRIIAELAGGVEPGHHH